MPLTPRTLLGPYEIVGPIGAGGMGEVYRARDTKLDRDVAIRVLPAHLAADQASRTRFEREAKAVAALSHPNILASYDFGLHDGVAYAVMELLQGETLRERLQQGGLPLRKVVQIGADIAQGLAAAHDKGIVHRDLKPENVFIAADGSDAAAGGVSVTNDTALDWNPTWSPDGRYLYFSSTRGGTMNLWRVEIEQTSGRVSSAPEPVTTPSAWSGNFSFSHDGTRLAFASLDYRSTLLRVSFDAARGVVVGPPVPIVKGTRPIRDHELSPDGEWVAFTESGVQEDLFVARVDGTQYRRLTDDVFRDRGPGWSPDGARIAFYSDRSGGYELWAIRPDGSGLAPLTKDTGVAGFPVWSPDGARLAFGFGRWYFVDGKSAQPTTPSPEPNMSATERYLPNSWSPNGARIAGFVVAADGATATLGVYTLATKQFTLVPGDLARASFWLTPTWLADSRRLIVRRPDGVALVDPETGAGHLLISVGGDMIGRSVGVSRDNRWITYTETASEGDIWIATLGPLGAGTI